MVFFFFFFSFSFFVFFFFFNDTATTEIYTLSLHDALPIYVIIVGTGAGGGTLAHKLAPTGKKILILERGDFMPLEEQNRSNVDVFKRERNHAPEQWYDKIGRAHV